MAKTKKGGRRRVPWAGWAKEEPRGWQRKAMLDQCGSYCFLGPKGSTSFPVCATRRDGKPSCRRSTKGLYAALIRAREWGNDPKSYKGDGHPRMEQRVYEKAQAEAARELRRRGYDLQREEARQEMARRQDQAPLSIH